MTRQHKNLEAEAHVPAEELSDTDLEKATGGSGKVRHSDFVMVKLLMRRRPSCSDEALSNAEQTVRGSPFKPPQLCPIHPR